MIHHRYSSKLPIGKEQLINMKEKSVSRLFSLMLILSGYLEIEKYSPHLAHEARKTTDKKHDLCQFGLVSVSRSAYFKLILN